MRKSTKDQLRLHRETLRNLERGALEKAAGGAGTKATCGNPCSIACTERTCTVTLLTNCV
jgi:hypothetical protein